MKDKLTWGGSSYSILSEGNVIMERNKAACFSEFMNRFEGPYDTIRIYDIDCKPTIEYKNWFLQYVIDMFQIDGSFNDEYFEFKTQGIKKKDATVMTVIRMLWEDLGNNSNVDSPNELFKKLRDGKFRYRDKLKKFCYVYSKIPVTVGYFSTGHNWKPEDTKIRSTKDYLKQKDWPSVNSFFIKDEY